MVRRRKVAHEATRVRCISPTLLARADEIIE